MVGSYRSIGGTLAVIVLVCLVALFGAVAVPQAVGADESYIVLSDSMAPSIEAGDVVFVSNTQPAAVERGDIISFERPGSSDDVIPDEVTHRVVEIVDRQDGRYFQTKGDANDRPDAALVPAGNLIGVVGFSLPFIGYVVTAVNSGAGILLFVVLPALLLIVNELWTLWRAATSEGE